MRAGGWSWVAIAVVLACLALLVWVFFVAFEAEPVGNNLPVTQAPTDAPHNEATVGQANPPVQQPLHPNLPPSQPATPAQTQGVETPPPQTAITPPGANVPPTNAAPGSPEVEIPWVPRTQWLRVGGYLTGVVADEAGYPLSGLRVWAVRQFGESPGTRAQEQGLSDTDGAFRLAVYPGEYVVSVAAEVGEFRSAVYVVHQGESLTVLMPRIPAPAQIWWLMLQDGDGHDLELPHAMVVFQPQRADWYLRGTPVVPGRFDPPEGAPPLPDFAGRTCIRLGIDAARARQYENVALTGQLTVLPGDDRFFRLQRELELPRGGGEVAVRLSPAGTVEITLRVRPDMVPLQLYIRTLNTAEPELVQRIGVGQGGLTPAELLDNTERLRSLGIVEEARDDEWHIRIRVGLPVETPITVDIEARYRRGDPSPLNPGRSRHMEVSVPRLHRDEAYPVSFDLLQE